MTKEQLTQSCRNMISRLILFWVGKRKRKQVYQFLYILGARSFLRRYFLSTYLSNSPGYCTTSPAEIPGRLCELTWYQLAWQGVFLFEKTYHWFETQGFCDDNCSPLRILTPQKWLFWEAQTPGFLQLQTLPLEGSMILRVYFVWFGGFKGSTFRGFKCW